MKNLLSKKFGFIAIIAFLMSGLALNSCNTGEEEKKEEYKNEGTFSAPIELTLDIVRSSTVGDFNGSYYKFTPAKSGAYKAEISGHAGIMDINIYKSTDEANFLIQGKDLTSGGSVTYNMTANASYVIKVAGGQTKFSLIVSKGLGDGSADEPAALAEGTNTTDLAAKGASYFTINNTSAQTYKFEVSSNNNISMSLIGKDKNGTGITGYRFCINLSLLDCYYSLPSGKNVLELRNYSDTEGKTVTVKVTKTKNNTAQSDPLALSLSGTAVDSGNDGGSISGLYSFYKFTTSATAINYTVVLTTTDTAPSVFVRNLTPDSADNTASPITGKCSAITLGASCFFENTEPNKQYILSLQTTSESSYKISASPSMRAGTAATNPITPMTLTLGQTYDTGFRYFSTDTTASYYKFTATANSHTIGAVNVDGPWNYTVYSDNTFSTIVKAKTDVIANKGITEAIPGLNSGITYFLKITGASGSSGEYNLSLKVY